MTRLQQTARLSLILLTLALAQWVLIQPGYAQRVQPMVFDLEPIGAGASTSLRIENTQQQSLTVEMLATRISLDEYGNETLTSAEDDFLIYPPQTLIEKGKTQIVHVKYIGDPLITKSRAYRVSVKQLPVDFKEDGHTGVGLVINFNTLVNVSPKGSKAELNVTEVVAAPDNKWMLTIKNTGDRFSRLSTTAWEVSDANNPALKQQIKSLEVGRMTEKNLVMPNSTLRVLIPQIESFNPDSTQIKITGR